MSNLYDIGKSGLQSYRQSLAVTGQNIANINTDGYKRRGTDIEEVTATKGSVFDASQGSGMGARIGLIRRASNEFLLTKARTATAFAESSGAYISAAKQIENIMLPGDANLGNAIGQMFESLQQLSTDPANLAGRTVALERSKQVTDNFIQVATLLEEMKTGLNTQAEHLVSEVNVLAIELERVNKQLATGSQLKVNNSLLDARDLLIDKINEKIEVHVELDDRHLATLTLGDTRNGPVLVSPTSKTHLGTSGTDQKLSLMLDPGVQNILSDRVTGGQLGGLVNAYQTAVEMQDEVDSLAFMLARDMNAIHKLGLNVEGQSGGDFFKSISPEIHPNRSNTGDASASVDIINPDLINVGRVTFSYDDQTDVWTGRNIEGTAVASGKSKVSIGGVEILFSGKAHQFDQFIYDPVKDTAKGLTLAIRRPEDIAAASSLMVSPNATNEGSALIDALPVSATQFANPPALQSVLANAKSAISSTEFIASGSVAVIPSNVTNVDILSLQNQSKAQFVLALNDLGKANSIALTVDTIAANGSTVTETVTFNIGYQNVKGFQGLWQDASQISEVLNRGLVKGTSSLGGQKTLSELGAYVSAKSGNLNFSHGSGDFTAATIGTTTGGSFSAVTSARQSVATEVQIFTRNGRHVAGTTPDETKIASYQSAMTVDNGFHKDAVYLGNYLNASGDAGYLGLSVNTFDQSSMLTNVTVATGSTTTQFKFLNGVNTDEESVDGQTSLAKTVDYKMTIAGTAKSVGPDDFVVNEGSGSVVASTMIEKFRADAAIASLVGDVATPNLNEVLKVNFEGNVYTVTVKDKDAFVTGGEPGRLNAFFDTQNRFHIVSNSGSVGKSNISIPIDNNDPTNVNVARRLGLMEGLIPATTRFSDEFQYIQGTGTSGVNNTITLTFSADDTYNLKFIFDEKPNSGSTAATDKEIGVTATMSGNDATAIANAINTAIANNAGEVGGGSSLSGIASAAAVGNVVTLTVTDGKAVDIERLGAALSTGNGNVAIAPVTIGSATKTLDDAKASPGYDLTVSGSKIVATAQASGTNPVITASGTGLASQRLTLTDLPDEELIVFLSEGGARRLLTQYDEAPAGTPKPMRDLEIRVKDAVNKTIEVVDTETATSISTRILDDENSALLEGFKVTFDGALLDGDKFSITGNTSGIGDNRNLQAILQLQHGPSGNDTSGAFQKVYNNAISRLGSLVQSGQLASEAATSLKEASIEAESAYSGVNLDAEAANLIQQQQAYQASARILSTARELFETLIQTL